MIMTAEEILDNQTKCTIEEDIDLDNPNSFYFHRTDALKAMREFTSLKTKELEDEKEKLIKFLYEKIKVNTYHFSSELRAKHEAYIEVKNLLDDDNKSQMLQIATAEMLDDIISWEKDLSEYKSLESILNKKYLIYKK